MALFKLVFLSVLFAPVLSSEEYLRRFKCKNGKFIQQLWRCDGEDDCGDNSDESKDDCLTRRPCDPSKEFQCKSNGLCIPLIFKCDREPDCLDGSDEDPAICSTDKCLSDQFRCDREQCIPDMWVCDGKEDCKNGLDEANCASTCKDGEFTCPTDGKCLELNWQCDGDRDCEDGADEDPSVCAPELKGCVGTDFTCKDGSGCVPAKFRCDGDFDCRDKSDELIGCNHTRSSHPLKQPQVKICRSEEFACSDNYTCIHRSWLCDGDHDCPNGDDESRKLCANVSSNYCKGDEWRCPSDGACVLLNKRCDGLPDCADHSDEESCDCMDDEFRCGSGECIPLKKACDGVKNCPYGDDEPADRCGVNECNVNNGGCTHTCTDTRIGHQCRCYPGHRLVGNSSCEDINECLNPTSCSHDCVNSIGTFVCTCRSGYKTDPSDRTRCLADSPTPLQLIVTMRQDIRSLFPVNAKTPGAMNIIMNDTKASAALDVSYRKNAIFWYDVEDKTIYTSSIRGGPSVPLITKDIEAVDGLAIDWAYRHIYWTNPVKNTIEVANLEIGGSRKTLVSGDIDEPRALALDPQKGWMYWTDWGKAARIERAGLDGSHRQIIVSYDIQWPNGLTLDHLDDRLYWVDGKRHSINSVRTDGSQRRLVLSSEYTLHHPYSVTVFADTVFWTDWDRQAIYQADKLDGRNIIDLTANMSRFHNPMVIQAVHPYRQPEVPAADDHCSELACSDLCLRTPQLSDRSPQAACACSDDLELTADGRTCQLVVTTPPTWATKRPSRPHKPHTPEVVVIDFIPPTSTFPPPSADDVNWGIVLLIVIVGSSIFTFVLVGVCYVVYQLYLHGNWRVMKFDNPIYHKTPTQEEPLCSSDRSSNESFPTCPV